jgi:hypothetical protein
MEKRFLTKPRGLLVCLVQLVNGIFGAVAKAYMHVTLLTSTTPVTGQTLVDAPIHVLTDMYWSLILRRSESGIESHADTCKHIVFELQPSRTFKIVGFSAVLERSELSLSEAFTLTAFLHSCSFLLQWTSGTVRHLQIIRSSCSTVPSSWAGCP